MKNNSNHTTRVNREAENLAGKSREKETGKKIIAGTIGRFKPLHNGGAVLLETLCEKSGKVFVGIGSCNRYNARNPFTAEESNAMIDALLGKRFNNYSVLLIPDFGHLPEYKDGQKWRNYVLEQFGKLDYFVTGNAYVADLLSRDYNIIHPDDFIPKEKQVRLRATEVRVEMAKGENWTHLVPEEIAEYIRKNGLDKRFRNEFGLKTLALLGTEYWIQDNCKKEKANVSEA